MGRRADLRREVVPAGFGKIARQASSQRETTRSAVELRAEARRDGKPSLVVHRVPVLAGEHRSGHSLTSGWSLPGPIAGRPLWRGLRVFPTSPPLCATSRHHSARAAPSMRFLHGSWRDGSSWARRSACRVAARVASGLASAWARADAGRVHGLSGSARDVAGPTRQSGLVRRVRSRAWVGRQRGVSGSAAAGSGRRRGSSRVRDPGVQPVDRLERVPEVVRDARTGCRRPGPCRSSSRASIGHGSRSA